MRAIWLALSGILLFSFPPKIDAERGRQSSEPMRIHFVKLAAGPCMSKGRLQDPEYDKSKDRLEEMNHIMRHGTDSLAALADSLTDSHPVRPVLCYWKSMALGDVALITLLDLFREPGGRSTVPELDWDTFLDRSSPKLSAEQVLREFVRKHRRRGLREKWDTFWNEHKDEVIWDERDRCYRARPGHPQ